MRDISVRVIYFCSDIWVFQILVGTLLSFQTLSQIEYFQSDEKFTDTILRFSDGYICVHWVVLEAHGRIWWTLARETGTESIVEVIIPEVSVAEGQIFVDEIYSGIQSFKSLNHCKRTAPISTLIKIRIWGLKLEAPKH